MEEQYRRSERVVIKEKLRRQRSLREQKWLLILGTCFLGLKNSNILKCIFRCVEALELSRDWYPKSVMVLALLIISLELQNSCSHQVHNNIIKQRREDNMVSTESLRHAWISPTQPSLRCLAGRGVCNIFWKATTVPWVTCSPKTKLLILSECIFGI